MASPSRDHRMGRRQLLMSLGLAAGAAYVAPAMLQLSEARASGGSFSGGSFSGGRSSFSGGSSRSGGGSGSSSSFSGGAPAPARPAGRTRVRRRVVRRRRRLPLFLRRYFNFS